MRQQIEAIKRNQQIQTKEMDIVSRESTFPRDKISTLEQAKNTDSTEKITSIPNTQRSKPPMVQFQEDIGYLTRNLRTSSRVRSLSLVGFKNLRNCQALHENTSGNRSTMDHTISNFSLRKEKMMAPTFTGEKNEKPIKFLKEMRRYIQPSESSLEELKYVLSRNLKGNAASWWYVAEDSVHSFEDFEEQFREKFWSEEVTEALVRRIENGNVYP